MKNNLKHKLTALFLLIILLFGITKKDAKALDLVNDFNNLFCTPSTTSSGAFGLSGPAAYPFTLATSAEFRGAISSLIIGGEETISTVDYGRELQYAYYVNGGGLKNNPVEAMPSSVFMAGCKSTNRIYTKSQMGYWLAYNGNSLSPFRLEKIVGLNAFSMPNVISFKARYFIPKTEDITALSMEIPTGYHIARSFRAQKFKLFDTSTNTLRDPLPSEIKPEGYVPKSYRGRDIPVMWNGYYALAAYSPMATHYFWGTDDNTYLKWAINKAEGPIESRYFYSVGYLILDSSLDGVTNKLKALIAKATTNPQSYSLTENTWSQQPHGGVTNDGSEYTMDGVDDNVEITDYPFDGLNQLSVEAYFNPDLTTAGTYTILNKPDGLISYVKNDGSGACNVSTFNQDLTDPNTLATWPAGKIANGKWNHLICVYDGSKIISYINGQKVGVSGSVSGQVNNSVIKNNLYVGRFYSNISGNYKGMFKSVTLWRNALTDTEVALRYQNIIGNSVKTGDLNGDGSVNLLDFNIFKSDFGKSGAAGFIPADINKDGTVNIFDYNILVANFGS